MTITYPPGPSLPPAQLASMYRRDPIRFVGNCIRRYGDISYFHLGEIPTYIVQHLPAVEDVLLHRSDRYGKDRYSQRFRRLLGNALVADESPTWRRARSALHAQFRHSRAVGSEHVIADSVEQRVHRWHDGETIDAYTEMSELSLDIMLRLLFDSDGRCDTSALRVAASEAIALMRAGMERPFRSSDPTALNPEAATAAFRESMQRVRAAVAATIAERVVKADHDMSDVLSVMLRPGTPWTLDQDRLGDELVSLLVSSHDTTALALTYTWHLLGTHPQVLNALRRDPSLTSAIVKESLRVLPPVWLLTREASTDDVLAGYPVPAGSMILISRWALHRDPRWYADPTQFKPERWTDGSTSQLPALAYFPFGAGPRRCIGAELATVELEHIVTTVSRAVDLEPAYDRLDLLPSIHVRPRNGLPMTVRQPREELAT